MKQLVSSVLKDAVGVVLVEVWVLESLTNISAFSDKAEDGHKLLYYKLSLH
jgi:hypothetical protein